MQLRVCSASVLCSIDILTSSFFLPFCFFFFFFLFFFGGLASDWSLLISFLDFGESYSTKF